MGRIKTLSTPAAPVEMPRINVPAEAAPAPADISRPEVDQGAEKKIKSRVRVAVDLQADQIERIYAKLSRRMAETRRPATVTDYLRELIEADLARELA